MRFNFEKQSQSEVNSLGIKYDYDSVMHYGPYDFSRNGSKTITAKKKTNIKFGSKPRLSKSDKQQAQLLYKCKGKFSYLLYLFISINKCNDIVVTFLK